MNIICISGKAGHGKDTLAGYMKEALEEHGKVVLIAHYGDLLKYICKQFFGWNGKKDEVGRDILQNVGTNVIRKQDPDFWVDFMRKMLDFFMDEWDYVLIPDTRFPNEIEGLQDLNVTLKHIRIVRPGFSTLTEEQQRHPSETALDKYPYDTFIINHGTLLDLREKARNLI